MKRTSIIKINDKDYDLELVIKFKSKGSAYRDETEKTFDRIVDDITEALQKRHHFKDVRLC